MKRASKGLQNPNFRHLAPLGSKPLAADGPVRGSHAAPVHGPDCLYALAAGDKEVQVPFMQHSSGRGSGVLSRRPARGCSGVGRISAAIWRWLPSLAVELNRLISQGGTLSMRQSVLSSSLGPAPMQQEFCQSAGLRRLGAERQGLRLREAP